MRPLRVLALAGLVTALAGPLGAQVNFDTVQVRATPLSPNLHVLFGAGGNIAVSSGPDGTFIVDDQFAPLTPKIVAAIRGFTPSPVKFVLNTHWHGDHTGGNENFGNAGAIIVAHDNVRTRMSVGQLIAATNTRAPGAPRAALPVVTFPQSITLHINGDSVLVTHLAPSHTDGDAMVHFTRTNAVHMGDVFNNTGLPFIDLSSGGSVDGFVTNADIVYRATNAQTRIIPGHGQVTDRERLRAWGTAILTVRNRVERELRSGKTVEQVLAMKLSADYEKEWPGGHERFIRTVYQQLSGR